MKIGPYANRWVSNELQPTRRGYTHKKAIITLRVAMMRVGWELCGPIEEEPVRGE